MPGYYTLLGALQFYKLRSQIPHTPVSQRVQNFFAKSFYSTKPIFGFLSKSQKISFLYTMVSAIVLAYNRCAEVLLTIEKLKSYRQTLPFNMEIIVVDNASVDDTSRQVSSQHPDITLVTKPKNNGIAGWNEGFAVATSKYFLVLDDDSHIHSGLPEAIDYLEHNKAVGILALHIKDAQLREYDIPADIAWKDKEDVEGFIGCGAIIRKDVYDIIGGYAEWVHVYTHEFDYAIRCMQAGYKVRFFKNAVVAHRVSAVNWTNKRIRLYGTRNEMALIYKYFPQHRWKYILRVWINNLKNMKAEGWRSGYSVLLGGIAFLKLKNSLTYTPVNPSIQQFYTQRFGSAKPVFEKLRKRIFPA